MPTSTSIFDEDFGLEKAADAAPEPDAAETLEVFQCSLTQKIILWSVAGVLLVLTVVFWTHIDEFLKSMKDLLTAAGPAWGYVIISLLLAITSFPVPGYAVMLLLAGYMFKFNLYVWLATSIGSLI